jgi:hypothetical protein
MVYAASARVWHSYALLCSLSCHDVERYCVGVDSLSLAWAVTCCACLQCAAASTGTYTLAWHQAARVQGLTLQAPLWVQFKLMWLQPLRKFLGVSTTLALLVWCCCYTMLAASAVLMTNACAATLQI